MRIYLPIINVPHSSQSKFTSLMRIYHFTKGNNFCDFQFISTEIKKSSLLLEKRICLKDSKFVPLTLSVPETKIAEFANSADLDEVAHNEPPHLDLHCLPSSL